MYPLASHPASLFMCYTTTTNWLVANYFDDGLNRSRVFLREEKFKFLDSSFKNVNIFLVFLSPLWQFTEYPCVVDKTRHLRTSWSALGEKTIDILQNKELIDYQNNNQWINDEKQCWAPIVHLVFNKVKQQFSQMCDTVMSCDVTKSRKLMRGYWRGVQEQFYWSYFHFYKSNV